MSFATKIRSWPRSLTDNNIRTGTWIATTDMYLVKENFEENLPLGFLSREHTLWCASNQKIHALQKRTKAKMLYGHCKDTLELYKAAPHSYA